MDTSFYMEDLLRRYPRLGCIQDAIQAAYEMLQNTYETGGKLLVAGNGGSAADAEHMVGELLKGFLLPRTIDEALAGKMIAVDEEIGAEMQQYLQKALPAVSLMGHLSFSTAFANDANGEYTIAQHLLALGQTGDCFIAISTSGNARNLLRAAVLAKAKGVKIIALTGDTGGQLAAYADVLVNVPEAETFKAQELHLPIYHCLCLMLEEHFFGEG